VAWKASWLASRSASMHASSDGIICESPRAAVEPVEPVEARVAGRWLLCAAICASERAVSVRPACPVSPQPATASGRASRTFSVGRMLLDLPAQLGHLLPAPGASSLVQLLEVALGLVALGGLLCRGELRRRP
jgi:hypothetical protein